MIFQTTETHASPRHKLKYNITASSLNMHSTAHSQGTKRNKYVSDILIEKWLLEKTRADVRDTALTRESSAPLEHLSLRSI